LADHAARRESLSGRWIYPFSDEVLSHILDRISSSGKTAIDQCRPVAFARVGDGFGSHAINGHYVVAVDVDQGQGRLILDLWNVQFSRLGIGTCPAAEHDKKDGQSFVSSKRQSLVPCRLRN